VTERTKVSELNSEPFDAKSQLRELEDQYEFQIRTGAGNNDQQPEQKDPTARRLLEPDVDQEERAKTPPPRTRPGEPGSAGTDLRNPVGSPSQSQADAQTPSAAKFKEAERIRVTAWPKPASYRQWRMNLVDEIVAASARPKRAFEWILEVQCPGIAYDELAEPGDDMATLDAKLSSALAHVAPAEFQRTLQTKKLDAMKEGRMIADRQILLLIDQHFRMSEMDGGVYDTEHLFSVKMKGESSRSSSLLGTTC
jgi:hypothetical protein